MKLAEGVDVEDQVVQDVAGQSSDDLVNWVEPLDDIGEHLVAQFEERSVLAFPLGDNRILHDLAIF